MSEQPGWGSNAVAVAGMVMDGAIPHWARAV